MENIIGNILLPFKSKRIIRPLHQLIGGYWHSLHNLKCRDNSSSFRNMFVGAFENIKKLKTKTMDHLKLNSGC